MDRKQKFQALAVVGLSIFAASVFTYNYPGLVTFFAPVGVCAMFVALVAGRDIG